MQVAVSVRIASTVMRAPKVSTYLLNITMSSAQHMAAGAMLEELQESSMHGHVMKQDELRSQ